MQDDEFNVTEQEVTAVTGKEPINGINRIWVKSFAQRLNMIVRCRTGKKKLNETQVLQSNRETAYHFGKTKVAYENGLDHRHVENYDETHFFDPEESRVLDFKGTKRIY